VCDTFSYLNLQKDLVEANKVEPKFDPKTRIFVPPERGDAGGSAEKTSIRGR
jgi:hypothetical protein